MREASIYIVDDNEAVCHAIALLFHCCCHLSVKTYHNPQLFLEEFSSDCRGCLLIDLDLPSMNGIDLMATIKQYNKEINIIIMSGHGTADVADKAMAAGAYTFMSKPFKMEYLLEQLQEMHLLF